MLQPDETLPKVPLKPAPWDLRGSGWIVALKLPVTHPAHDAFLPPELAGRGRGLASSLPADMAWPVRIYMIVIGLMSALACGVTAAGGPWAVAVGALAFTASDVSVARDRFVRHEFLNRAWGLPLYYGAQLLLAATPGLT